ncbi:MAG: acylneuraminate cytidylyltransferase family protein [Flavobacteriaceae bacterium]
MKCIAIIPARGGSKGLKNKNITPFLGRPLIQWPVLACLESELIDSIFVTTDSNEIAEAAEGAGAIVPFLRDQEFATDTCTTEETLKYALLQYEQKFDDVDIVVFLTCTEIFRDPGWIDQCINELLNNPEVESAFIGEPTFKNFWSTKNGRFKRFDPSMKVHGNRQEKRPNFREDTGLCCATRASIIRSGYRIGDEVSIIENNKYSYNTDIHSKIDLDIAEYFYKLYKSNCPEKVSFFTKYAK